jgi:hypothetical protein
MSRNLQITHGLLHFLFHVYNYITEQLYLLNQSRFYEIFTVYNTQYVITCICNTYTIAGGLHRVAEEPFREKLPSTYIRSINSCTYTIIVYHARVKRLRTRRYTPRGT